MYRFLLRGALLLPLALALGALGPLAVEARPAAPRIFLVNSYADVPAGGDLSNGICQTAANNTTCTLRAAIMKANHYPGGGVTVRLPYPAAGPFYLSLPATGGSDDEYGGDLNLNANMTLDGTRAQSSIIDASFITPTTRVVAIGAGATVTITGVTLQGGYANGAEQGGGVFANDATLHLLNSVIVNNRALGAGGGLYNYYGSLFLSSDTVSHNLALNNGGGGISSLNGNLDLNVVTLGYNAADGEGGGVSIAGGTLKLTMTTLMSNTSLTTGGGLFNEANPAILINSTLAYNTAADQGGGLINGYGPGCCTVKLFNVTVADNQAANLGGGIDSLGTGTVMFQNTILSNNTLINISYVPSDCSGTLESLGNDLVSSTSGCTVLGGAGNLLDQFARLRPLAANGAATPTFALNPDSPAVDAGSPTGCVDELGQPLKYDQRFKPRTANYTGVTRCDIGAYELQRTLSLPLVRR